jgi:hypothetical protein
VTQSHPKIGRCDRQEGSVVLAAFTLTGVFLGAERNFRPRNLPPSPWRGGGGVVEWWSGGLLACPLNPVWDARATHSGTGYSLCHFTLRARRDVLKGLLARAFPRKKMQVMARVHSLFIDVLAFASLTCSLDLSGRNRQEKVRHSYGPKGPP